MTLSPKHICEVPSVPNVPNVHSNNYHIFMKAYIEFRTGELGWFATQLLAHLVPLKQDKVIA